MRNYQRYLSVKLEKYHTHIHILIYMRQKIPANQQTKKKYTDHYVQDPEKSNTSTKGCSIDSAEIQINRQHCFNSNTLFPKCAMCIVHLASLKMNRIISSNFFSVRND